MLFYRHLKERGTDEGGATIGAEENRKKFLSTNYLNLSIRLHKVHDKEVIDKLAKVENKRQYIIDLIKKDK